MTTNPLEATGDGIAMALRAGVAVADLEFIQFHPTALNLEAMPRPLLTEALRGHGALLRDTNGERFVDELLPRDVVSRAETRRMLELGTDHVLLDVRDLEAFDRRFPNIAADLRAVGLRPGRRPAAGGAGRPLHVRRDRDRPRRRDQRCPGLWAAGEAACSGVHGANRLASNSLLEGMVFGPRAVEAIDDGVSGPEATGAMRAVLGADADRPTTGARRRDRRPLPAVRSRAGSHERHRRPRQGRAAPPGRLPPISGPCVTPCSGP